MKIKITIKKLLLALTIVIGSAAVSSCGSNTCATCGKTLSEGGVKATLTTGKKVTVCHNCYVVGKQFGQVL